MFSPFLSSFIFVTLLMGSAHANGVFRICAEPSNLPMSDQKSQSGYEIEVASLLAEAMKEKLEVNWIAQRDHSYFRQTIGKDACDAIMSVPSEFHRLTTTRPWYKTGFVFVREKDKKLPQSFDDESLAKMQIGVPATGLGDLPPVMALSRRSLAKNLHHYSVYDPARLISGLEKKDIDLAVVWGPFGGWLAHKKNMHWALTPEKDFNIPMTFSMSVGVKKGNVAMKKKIEKALDQQKDKIAAVLMKWHVPVREK
jgi:mxaJ protein